MLAIAQSVAVLITNKCSPCSPFRLVVTDVQPQTTLFDQLVRKAVEGSESLLVLLDGLDVRVLQRNVDIRVALPGGP